MFSHAFTYRRVSVLVAFLFACYGVSANGQSAGAPLSLKTAPASQNRAASMAARGAEEETGPLQNDASHQDIKVHGHWKIVVKNADGSIAETRDFENSLTYQGNNTLRALLDGGYVSGGLVINLSTTGTSICGNLSCAIVPSTTGGPGYTYCSGESVACAANLTVSGSPLVVAGQFTAYQAGTITQVATAVGVCGNTITGSACATGTSTQVFAFTGTTISAVSVNSGQVVQVSVTISFA